ncbi:hypothetical protein FISHEDRAFT_53931, partial [Fistulina hepatica ATCC 64428]
NMADRPRRNTRKPLPRDVDWNETPRTTAQRGVKRKMLDPSAAKEAEISKMLTSSRSVLTQIDIAEIINANTWDLLSQDVQSVLMTLLPAPAFREFQPAVHPSHPAADTVSGSQSDSSAPSTTLDKNIFTDAHFLAAARTFQDHLASNWLSEAHKEKVQRYEQSVREGTASAPFKDDVWLADHPVENEVPVDPPESEGIIPMPNRTKRPTNPNVLRLHDLIQHSVIMPGDILAYSRRFAQLGLLIEKDVLIVSVNPRDSSVTVLLESGTESRLPTVLIYNEAASVDPPLTTRSMTVTTPSMLETGILDVDGRIDRSKRPNGNPWKRLSVWREQTQTDNAFAPPDPEDPRGGRQNRGTLFYLRDGLFYDRFA